MIQNHFFYPSGYLFRFEFTTSDSDESPLLSNRTVSALDMLWSRSMFIRFHIPLVLHLLDLGLVLPLTMRELGLDRGPFGMMQKWLLQS